MDLDSWNFELYIVRIFGKVYTRDDDAFKKAKAQYEIWQQLGN